LLWNSFARLSESGICHDYEICHLLSDSYVEANLAGEGISSVNRAEVRARIEEVGIVPAVRVSSEHVARFAAEAVASGGIPIVEIEMTVPGALDVIRYLVEHTPDMTVGAGSVYDTETARRCMAAGAQFLTTDGLDLSIIEFANKEDIAVWPAALTPTEVINAWKASPDFVKVFPCAPVGGDSYIRTLKKPFAHIPLIAAGGVNQQTAQKFIIAGATALGVGADLIPEDALRLKQADRIRELAQRFVRFVKEGRGHLDALRKRSLFFRS
jgi:2-dehydro-3-deoxyphosphogluconate aldolase / (4S)-4-hydroxy-2-oxoglutarate aldolase